MVAHPSTMIHTQAGHQWREPMRLFTVSIQKSVGTNVWRSEISDELNLSFGTCQAILTQGFCTTTVCHATWPWVSGNSWPRTASPWFPTRPTHQIWPPCDFFLFPRLKSTLKGKQFQDIAEIQLNTTWQLQAIPKQAYQVCVEKLKDRWNRCIQSGGSYFEGDNFE
jgi:hypothetical protein